MIQIDIDMPKTCDDCPFHIYHSGKNYVCVATPLFYPMNLANYKDGRKDFCPLVEAIPKAEYEARLKADLKAILVELQMDIEEMTPTYHNPDWSITDLVSISEVNKFIQEKINSLKEDQEAEDGR